MHKIWSLIYHRVVWTIGAAWLAGVAAQAMLGVVLKALGLLHGASLHTWLLDVGHNMGPLGAAGGLGAAAAAAAAANDPPPPKDKDPDPCASQAEDVLKASGTVDMLKGQLQSVENQIDALMGPINAAAANAAALASDVHTEVAEQAAITVVTKVIQLRRWAVTCMPCAKCSFHARNSSCRERSRPKVMDMARATNGCGNSLSIGGPWRTCCSAANAPPAPPRTNWRSLPQLSSAACECALPNPYYAPPRRRDE